LQSARRGIDYKIRVHADAWQLQLINASQALAAGLLLARSARRSHPAPDPG